MSKLHYGVKVRRERELRGLSRDALAREIGVSTSTVVRMEMGGHTPRVDALVALAQFFGISVDELLDTKATA